MSSGRWKGGSERRKVTWLPGAVRTLLFSALLVPGPMALAMPSASAGPAPATRSGPSLLYVCNQDDASVTVIDMQSETVVTTIDLTALGFSRNAKPHHVVVEPDGSFWYVSLIGDGKVVKFDRENHVVGTAPFSTPGMMTLGPAGDWLYVGRSMTAVNPPPRIGVIHRTDMKIDEIDVLFPRPHAIAVHPSGKYVYSASLGVNQLATVDVQAESAQLTDLAGPQHAVVQFAMSPDGRTMVGTTQLTGKALVFDLADPAHPRLAATLDVGKQPWHPVFTPDGRYVYFGNKLSNTVSVIDVPARKVVATIRGEGLAQPHGSAVSPDGRYIFISNNNKGPDAGHGAGQPGSVVVIDTRTMKIDKVITVGHDPTGIGAPMPH